MGNITITSFYNTSRGISLFSISSWNIVDNYLCWKIYVGRFAALYCFEKHFFYLGKWFANLMMKFYCRYSCIFLYVWEQLISYVLLIYSLVSERNYVINQCTLKHKTCLSVYRHQLSYLIIFILHVSISSIHKHRTALAYCNTTSKPCFI